VLYVAFEPHLRRIVYIRFFDAANMLTALIFIKKIRSIYGSRMIVLMDGGLILQGGLQDAELKALCIRFEDQEPNGEDSPVCQG